MEETQVILVDENDNAIGVAGKMQAHKHGRLHRAFSIFIFNTKGEMLLQQRALTKYHSGGLWTNACCSHPLPGEEMMETIQQRLHEEMGFVTPIVKAFDFIYRTSFENGLTEYEFDHVYVGLYGGKVLYDTKEVMDFCYKPMDEINASLQNEPGKYTSWFRIAFPKVQQWWETHCRELISRL